jgi:hypothetical protein
MQETIDDNEDDNSSQNTTAVDDEQSDDESNENVDDIQPAYAFFSAQQLFQAADAVDDEESNYSFFSQNVPPMDDKSRWATKSQVAECKVAFRRFTSEDKHLRKLCGLERDAFDGLVSELDEHFQSTDWNGERRTTKVRSSTAVPDIPTDVALFLTLHWLLNYPTMILMEVTFKLPELALSRLFRRTLRSLVQLTHEQLKWPKAGELLHWRLERTEHRSPENVVCFADGTILNSARSMLQFPCGDRNPFSADPNNGSDTNMNTVVVVAVGTDGKIIWSTDWQLQSMSERQISTTYGDAHDSFGIAADGGFSFSKKGARPKTITATPFQNQQRTSLQRRQFNELLADNRATVEKVSARLNRWEVVRGFLHHFGPNSENRGNLQDLGDIFNALCTIHNRDLCKHPI